jgi:hypothetical protein
VSRIAASYYVYMMQLRHPPSDWVELGIGTTNVDTRPSRERWAIV